MTEPSDYSSDLQRIFTEASRLENSDEIEPFLDKACGNNLNQKKLILRMLQSARRPSDNSGRSIRTGLQAISNAFSDLASSQAFLDDQLTEFPSIPRYEIVQLLGEGAMGRVYLADQLEPIRRSVAVKVIKPGMDSAQVLTRFESEKQTLAMLDHPNICEVYDAGTTDRGYPYFSMELVKGDTIDQYCRINRLSLNERIRLIIATCKATHHAHARNIIHRDLKPSNVLVKNVDGQPVVKVIDFGVAKALTTNPDQSLSETYFKQLIGTPLYMCPEQVMSGRKQIDARCDVYSLGGLLYKLVTGYEPIHRFDSSVESHETLQQLILDYVPPLASRKLTDADRGSPENLVHRLGLDSKQLPAWRRQVRGDLENVLSVALEKNPDARYQSALELAEDLQRVIDGVPVVAKKRFRLPKLASPAQLQLISVATLATLLLGLVYLFPKLQRDQPLAELDAAATSAVDSNAAVNNEALDYIEASRLQSMFKALAEHDLYTLSSIQLPKTASGKFLGEEDDDGTQSPSLRRLLERLGKPTPLLEMSSDSAVHDFCVSPDKRYVVAGYEDQHARIWSLEDGALLSQLPKHAGPVTAILFSSDGKILLTGDKEGVLTIWDASSLATTQKYDGTELPIIHRTPTQDAGIESLAFSPDNKLIAVGHRYDPIIIRDLTGAEVSRIDLGDPYARNDNIYFTEDSRQIICSNRSEGRIEWWDFRKQQLVDFTRLQEDNIVFSSYPREFYISPEIACFTSHQNPFVYSFDQKTGRHLTTLTVGANDISSLQLIPDENLLLTAHLNGAVCVTKLEGEPSNGIVDKSQSWTLGCHAGGVDPAAVKALALDRDRILTAGRDGRLCLWSLQSLLPTQYYDASESRDYHIASDGTAYAFEYEDDSVLVRRFDSPPINAGNSTLLPQAIRFLADQKCIDLLQALKVATPLAVHHPSQLLALPTATGIDIYNVVTGEKQAFISLDDDIPYKLDWASDGRTLVGLASNHVYAWKADDNGSSYVLFTKFLFDAPLTERYFGTIKSVAHGNQVAITYDRDYSLIDLATQNVIRKYSKDILTNTIMNDSEKYWAVGSLHGVEVYEHGSSAPVLQTNRTGALCLQFCDNDRILIGYGGSGLRGWHLPTATYIGEFPYLDKQDNVANMYLTNQSNLVTTTRPFENQTRGKVVFFGYPPPQN